MIYSITKIKKWLPPEENGVELLGMPNLPHQCHGLNPRTIMGQAKWDVMRRRCYMDADYTCEVCGKVCGHGRCQAHEVYEIDYETETVTFVRPVCLCQTCHQWMHSGRTITLFNNNEPQALSKMEMIKLFGDRAKMVQTWNSKHPGNKILLSTTFLEWAKNPHLKTSMESMFEMYDVEFATPDIPKLDNHWGKWKLIYNGKEYPSPYETYDDWKNKYIKEK